MTFEPNRKLPQETPRVIRLVRWMRVLAHIGVALAITSIFFPRANTVSRARLTRWWSGKLLRILRIRLQVLGDWPGWLEPNLVIASNHVSWADIYVINAVRPARFVAKSEIRNWPVVGWMCDRAGTIFIMRTRRRHTATINEVIHQVLLDGDCVGLFPEGTTSRGDMLRKFHSSLFEPAVVSRARVAPAAIRYSHSNGEICLEAAYINNLSIAKSLGLIIRQRTLIAEITFAAPISSLGKNRRDLACLVQTEVARLLDVVVSEEKFAPASAPHP